MGDSHISTSPIDNLRFMKALSISGKLLANYVHDINSHVPPVDFVLHLGDITDMGLTWEFARARRILDSLDCPVYSVLGNHDNFGSSRKQFWKKFEGRDSTSYTLDYGGFHFIFIDCTPDPCDPAKVGCDGTLRAWVAQDLAINHSKPTFVISHYNMWTRGWNAEFDTTGSYVEHTGMPELRRVL
ncbi:MAG: metallophosphoesterase [Candidatus Eisenbacteria bacterium]